MTQEVREKKIQQRLMAGIEMEKLWFMFSIITSDFWQLLSKRVVLTDSSFTKLQFKHFKAAIHHCICSIFCQSVKLCVALCGSECFHYNKPKTQRN